MTFFGSGPGEDPWKRRGEDDARIATATLPAAVPLPWPLATAPAGYLLCNGAVIPAGCPQLTAAYGANLPDLRGVTIVGYDASQAEFNTLLGSGGVKTVTLATAQIPSHNHTQNAHGHGADDNDTGSHSHKTTRDDHSPPIIGVGSTVGLIGPGRAIDATSDVGHTTRTSDDGSHNHNITVDAATATNQAAGGDGSHNNLQPYRVFNYIVRAA